MLPVSNASWRVGWEMCASTPLKLYEPLIKRMCQTFQNEWVYLALDSSVLWERFALIRVALGYRGRALALSWIVIKGQSASVAFETYQTILKCTAQVLPSTCQVVLLADRGFGDQQLNKAARDLGWHFRIRLRTSVWVGHHQRPMAKIVDLMPHPAMPSFSTGFG
jgi:hypothetical protein